LITSFLPTLIFLLYLIFIETKEKFSIATFGQNDSDDGSQKTFRLENTNGKLLLEVEIGKIICFEANDNYVVTYFLRHDDELSKSMERISLKKIEEMIENEGIKFERVHKSYLINPLFFDEVKGRSQAYKIKMKHFKQLIPVSRSYDVSIFNKQF
jgi:DNA-binding LytR/AlgR family response regulator